MLDLNSITDTPSELIQSRARKMWLKKVRALGGLVVFRVVPFGSDFNHKEKTKRRVTISMVNEEADCCDWYTGEPCQANADYVLTTGQVKEPRMCSHVWVVISHLTECRCGRRAA